MLDRRHALLLLLRALPDVGYQPETATGKMLRRSTLPGPAPHHQGACPTCAGVGRCETKNDQPRPCPAHRVHVLHPERELPPHACVACPTCNGRGTVPYDGYTNRPVVTDQNTAGQVTDQEARERRDRDRRRVDAMLADPDRSLSRDAIDAFFDACERRDREAPFRELAHALDELRSLHNLAYRKVVSVCVFATERRQDLHPRVQLRLDFGVRFIDRRMPARLRIPRDLVENDRLLREREQARFVHVRGKGDGQLGFRDREMRRLHTEESIPVLQLCIRFGLSRSQVYAILGGGKHSNGGDTVAA